MQVDGHLEENDNVTDEANYIINNPSLVRVHNFVHVDLLQLALEALVLLLL